MTEFKFLGVLSL